MDHCIFPELYCMQDTLSSRARLAFRPSARASKGILHCIQGIILYSLHIQYLYYNISGFYSHLIHFYMPTQFSYCYKYPFNPSHILNSFQCLSLKQFLTINHFDVNALRPSFTFHPQKLLSFLLVRNLYNLCIE